MLPNTNAYIAVIKVFTNLFLPFLADSPNVTGLVIDWLREKIYWTSIDIETSSPRLYLATLNGR